MLVPGVYFLVWKKKRLKYQHTVGHKMAIKTVLFTFLGNNKDPKVTGTQNNGIKTKRNTFIRLVLWQTEVLFQIAAIQSAMGSQLATSTSNINDVLKFIHLFQM